MTAFAAAIAAVILLIGLAVWLRHMQAVALGEARAQERQARRLVDELTRSIAEARASVPAGAAPSPRDPAPLR